MVKLLLILVLLCLNKDAFSAPAKTAECSVPMDVALLLDSSGSTGRRSWHKILKLAKMFVDRLGVSEDGTHFAILTFSTKPKIEVKFNSYNGTNLNSENIKHNINGLRLRKRYTFIDKALKAAEKDIFTVEAGMRKDKRKVVIVLTDGIQTKDRGPYTPLDVASNGLISKGVIIYALGVGSDIDVMSLLEIATSEDHVFSAKWLSSGLIFDMFVRENVCKNN